MTLDKRKAKTKSGQSGLQWPVYHPGQPLRDDDLNAAVTYTQELNKLLFRSLFGCGVVCGLEIESEFDHCGRLVVKVKPGIALDPCGEAIHIPQEVVIKLDEECGDKILNHIYVVARSNANSCGHRETACGCDGHSTSPTRSVMGYEIALIPKLPDCVCGHEFVPDPIKKAEEQAKNVDQTQEVAEQPNRDVLGGKEDVAATTVKNHCYCANPNSDANKDHYNGVCSACGCNSGDWVVLAYIKIDEEERETRTSYKVRRFIRPMRMYDPEVRQEEVMSNIR